jgi:hypothetical protein
MTNITVEPFNQTTWDSWQARGRAADHASAQRLRTVALALATVALLAATLWTLL